jgi:hypothetical protein
MRIIKVRRWRLLRKGEGGKWAAWLASLALVLGTQLFVGAQPAAAMPGLVKRIATSPTNSVSPKTATAICPAGTRVIGGGGWVFTISATDEKKVILTRLEPVVSVSGDQYVVTGMEVAPGITGNWWVEAYALCANTPVGHEITTATTTPSSSATQQTAAICTGSKKVYGTGARINNPGGQVTLQLTRWDNTRGIARVTAKEDANGYSGTWNVTAYAICANDLPGFVSSSAGTPTNSQDAKLATVHCPDGTFVHSTAVASSGTPPGLGTTPAGVAVQVLYPFNDLGGAQVYAVETTPTNVAWDVGIYVMCGP